MCMQDEVQPEEIADIPEGADKQPHPGINIKYENRDGVEDPTLCCHVVTDGLPAKLSGGGPHHADDLDLDALLRLERLKEKKLTELEKDVLEGKEEPETGEVTSKLFSGSYIVFMGLLAPGGLDW